MSVCFLPLHPVSCLLLQRRWDLEQHDAHRTKVNLALPVVDTKGMKTPAHIQMKRKKMQKQDERQAIIDRDNRLLSTKLSDILRSKGQVDNWNHYHPRSLNAEKRRAELGQVIAQNQAVHQRITSRQSEYRRHVWLDDWERNQQRRNDIGRFARGPAHKQRPERRVQFVVGEIPGSSNHSIQLSPWQRPENTTATL